MQASCSKTETKHVSNMVNGLFSYVLILDPHPDRRPESPINSVLSIRKEIFLRIGSLFFSDILD